MKKDLPATRRLTPDDDEDITRPPDSSGDDLEGGDSEFEAEPAAKRRKVRGSENSGIMDRIPSSSPSEPSDTRGALANEPSNIAASVFTFSQRNDDDEPGELFSQPSQSRKRPTTYGNRSSMNIHADDPKPKPKPKKKTQKSPARVSQDSKGFKSRDMTSALSRGMWIQNSR